MFLGGLSSGLYSCNVYRRMKEHHVKDLFTTAWPVPMKFPIKLAWLAFRLHFHLSSFPH